MKDVAHDEAILRAVGQDLRADRAMGSIAELRGHRL